MQLLPKCRINGEAADVQGSGERNRAHTVWGAADREWTTAVFSVTPSPLFDGLDPSKGRQERQVGRQVFPSEVGCSEADQKG